MIAVERKPAIMKSDVGLELISLITAWSRSSWRKVLATRLDGRRERAL